MKSLLFLTRVGLVANFNPDPAPLTETVKEAGFHVERCELNQSNQAISQYIFYNLLGTQAKKIEELHLPPEKLVLFMWEPPTVLPKMYRKKYAGYFKRIYTFNDDLVDNKKHFKFYYPVNWGMLEELPSFEEKKLCTIIAGYHKPPHWSGELYSEREKIIAFFETKPEGEFDFFGRNWGNTYKTYRGSIEDKIETLKNYRFSICFENVCDVNGYITEKIFDCFGAGCVPVYWGAPNVTRYIPKECFIDFRLFGNTQELYDFLKSMPKERYEAYLSHIRAFLKSDQAKLFSNQHFQRVFYEAVTAK